MVLQPNKVLCASSPNASYMHCKEVPAPELPGGLAATPALVTLRALLQYSKLDQENYGSVRWNPLGILINEDDKVLIKPNWVHHMNYAGHGLNCLVTNTSVIEAILWYVLKARPKSIIVADAPLQGCDFDALRAECRLDEMVERFETGPSTIEIMDLRRTVLPGGTLGNQAIENCRPLDRYVLFDLAERSELEPITHETGQFRVTMYNPHALTRTHAPGKHQYLVAREVIEADVVINVPKLKTHKKACITGALKNMVGINGHKEYLPHHRKGSSLNGGDCYPEKSLLKGLAENVLDITNSTSQPSLKCLLLQVYKLTMMLGRVKGIDHNLEGSWYGNDTVWRMCLDLQRILHYGRIDGTLDDHVQRKVITITDAIISGEGDGPLSPTPVPLGMMTLGANTAAIEWIHALLMGFDPRLIPLTRQVFSSSRYPLASFTPEEIIVEIDGIELTLDDLVANYSYAFRPPEGWQGHCELGKRSQGVQSHNF